jgi:polygalacturonase
MLRAPLPVLLASLLAVARAATFNVLAFGAVGDGVTSDTRAVRAALAAAAAANGGTVLLPAPYVFLTGCVNLTDNVEFRVEGTLLASPVSAGGNFVLVPPLPWYGGGQDAEMSGAPEWQSVVRAFGARNVSLAGGGVLDGNGGAAGGWWACFHAAPPLGPQPCGGYSRPQLLRLVHSVDVRVEGLTFRNSPSWTIHLANVSGAVVRNVTVLAPFTEGNTDGVDVDASDNVLIADMYYAGGDDAIAIKSGINFLGREFARPTRDVLITRLVVESGNGIAVGSEQSAGVQNVTFDGVLVSTARLGHPIKHGPYIKSERGRGGTASGVSFRNMRVEGANFAIGLTLNYARNLPPTNATATPRYEDISVVNFVSAGCASSFSFDGLNDSVITNVRLENVTTDDHAVGSTCDFTTGFCDALTNHCPPCFARV